MTLHPGSDGEPRALAREPSRDRTAGADRAPGWPWRGGWLEGERTETLRAVPRRCLEVVGDFERYPEWHRYVTAVTVHERDARGRAVLVETWGRWGERELGQVMRYSYPTPNQIAWVQERGDLDALEGSWGFRASGPGRTRARCHVALKPGWRLSLLLGGTAFEQLRDVALDHILGELRRIVELGG